MSWAGSTVKKPPGEGPRIGEPETLLQISWSAPTSKLTILGRIVLTLAGLLGLGGAVLASYGLLSLAWLVGHLVELTDIARGAPSGGALDQVAAPHPATWNEPSKPATPVRPIPPEPAAGLAESKASNWPSEEAGEKAVAAGAWPEYVRTECKNVFVYIVSTSQSSPLDSAASLASSRTGQARFRRVGQSLGEWEVLAITEDWSGLNPAVWLMRDREVCRAELAGNPSRVHVLPKPLPIKQGRRRKPRRKL